MEQILSVDDQTKLTTDFYKTLLAEGSQPFVVEYTKMAKIHSGPL